MRVTCIENRCNKHKARYVLFASGYVWDYINVFDTYSKALACMQDYFGAVLHDEAGRLIAYRDMKGEEVHIV